MKQKMKKFTKSGKFPNLSKKIPDFLQIVCISHQILASSAKFSRNSDKFSSKSGRKSLIFHSPKFCAEFNFLVKF